MPKLVGDAFASSQKKTAGAHPIILIGTSGDQYRLKMGSRLGADLTVNLMETQDPTPEIRRLTGDLGVDVSFEAAGSSEPQKLALRLVRKGGVCALTGLTGRRELTLVPDTDIVFKEITVVGCLMSAHGYAGALKIIESNRFPIEDLVTAEFPLDNTQKAFEYVEARTEPSIKVAVNPWLPWNTEG